MAPSTPAPLPAQIVDHCAVCFEEQLFSQGFALLSSAVCSSTAKYAPPKQHLALAATLAVHPAYTTRTSSVDKHAASNDALHLLSRMPAQALADSFTFSRLTTSRSKRARTRKPGTLNESDEETGDAEKLNLPIAGDDALWAKAEDFWSVVGWAFNCSVAQPHRWKRWAPWLQLVLDVLEKDLERRSPESEDEEGTDELEGALLTHYLSSVGDGRNNKRRIMRAILADGKSKALAEFSEIWKNETRAPKQKKGAGEHKHKKLDIEHEEFGDYYEDESDDDSPGSSKRPSRSVSRMSGTKRSRAATADLEPSDHASGGEDSGRSPAPATPSPTDTLGGAESVRLRQRLLALLASYALVNPTMLCDAQDLLGLYTEFLKPLPLPIFQSFVLPAKPYLDSDFQCALDQTLSRRLLAGSATNEDALLTQADFEAHIAPQAANSTTVGENAKLSLVVEDLLRLLRRSGRIRASVSGGQSKGKSSSLRGAVESGVRARKAKAHSRSTGEEDAVLENSGRRLLVMVDVIERGRL